MMTYIVINKRNGKNLVTLMWLVRVVAMATCQRLEALQKLDQSRDCPCCRWSWSRRNPRCPVRRLLATSCQPFRPHGRVAGLQDLPEVLRGVLVVRAFLVAAVVVVRLEDPSLMEDNRASANCKIILPQFKQKYRGGELFLRSHLDLILPPFQTKKKPWLLKKKPL